MIILCYYFCFGIFHAFLSNFRCQCVYSLKSIPQSQLSDRCLKFKIPQVSGKDFRNRLKVTRDTTHIELFVALVAPKALPALGFAGWATHARGRVTTTTIIMLRATDISWSFYYGHQCFYAETTAQILRQSDGPLVAMLSCHGF